MLTLATKRAIQDFVSGISAGGIGQVFALSKWLGLAN
jgi:hypothetical protein